MSSYSAARIRGVASVVQQAAIELRENLTPAEGRLWEALRAKRLVGLRFRAQHPVGGFILDFYCPAHKLAIELDGGVHDGTEAQDAARTACLSAYGCRVLRFTNDQVLAELPDVLAQIQAAAQEGRPPAPILGSQTVRSSLLLIIWSPQNWGLGGLLLRLRFLPNFRLPRIGAGGPPLLPFP